MKSKYETFEFIVPTCYLPALINGDYSGMEPEEEALIMEFINDVISEHGHANFSMGDYADGYGKDDIGFVSFNDVCGFQGADCSRIYLLV